MKTIIAVLSVIVIIIVSRRFIKVLAIAIEGHISNETVLSILALKTIVAVGALLPVSVFIGILMVLGRMYRDQEMAAIASAGGGVVLIYRSIFLLIFPLSIIAAALSMITTPWAEAEIRLLMHEDQQGADVRGISAGRFSEYSHGNIVFYTEEIDGNKRMHNVFLQNRKGDKLGVINAQHARMENLLGGLYLILEQGERMQGVPGEVDFIIETFAEYAIRIEKKTTVFEKRRSGIPSEDLLSSPTIADVAELQERLSIPLSVIFLSFLAVPLAKLSPRGGVYGSMLVAFGIYFTYANLVRVSHSWVVKEIIPTWLGFFWIYLIMFILGCVLLIRLYGIKWIGMSIKERGVV